jgi:tRNA/tmRNA/rRNA uracil-C5-methylase (TrmA/RlmC/RlmD family)
MRKERTFHHALRAFRDAVLRRGYAIRLQYVHRINTSLTEQVPEETRRKHDILASIAGNGETTLAPAFTNAITSAEAAADARARADANARARQAGGRQRARRR